MAGQRDGLGPPFMEDMSMELMTPLTVKSILRLLHIGLLVDDDPSLSLDVDSSLSMCPAMAVKWHLLRRSWGITSQGPAWPPGRGRIMHRSAHINHRIARLFIFSEGAFGGGGGIPCRSRIITPLMWMGDILAAWRFSFTGMTS